MANAPIMSFEVPTYSGLLYTKSNTQTPFINLIAEPQYTNHVQFAVDQEYSLDTPSQPAISEQASMTAPDTKKITRTQHTNVTQIYQRACEISYAKESNMGTMSGINIAGQQANPGDEWNWQISRQMLNIANDIEFTSLQGEYNAATTDATINKSRGILTALTTNVIDAKGSGSTAAALTKAMIKSLVKSIFDNGGDVVAAISKRPDLRPILSILEEQGDEIISRADSIAFEIDMDKEIVKKVFALAEKYHKPVYAVVSNMSIAVERRDFFRSTHCFVCNQQEAGILFSEDYDDKTPEEMQRLLAARIRSAQIPRMVVTMGAQGAVYATNDGEEGWCPAKKVDVKDTTGAGDAFFAGVTIGLTYGKTMAEACEIGTRLAASVICTSENVCPRFLPSEFGIDPSGLEREQLSLEL